MSKVFGRIDDMLVIRGVNVYPSEIEAVLVAEPTVGPNYLLVVDRTEAMPRLVVACETTATIAHDDQREATSAAVADALAQRLGLATEVKVLPIGTIPRIEMGKARRVAVRTADHDPLADWR
jgi:phenylacetate-CoA ligase